MQIAYPFRKSSHGLIAATDERSHVFDMMEQVLFTSPGERVNRPDFGCGLALFLFQSPNQEMVVALQAIVQSSLQRWLGDLIRVEALTIEREDSQLTVAVQYSLLSGGGRFTDRFRRTRKLTG